MGLRTGWGAGRALVRALGSSYLLALAGCSGGSGGSSAPQPPAAPSAPATEAGDGFVRLTWPSNGAQDYTLYWGTHAGIDPLADTPLGNVTSPFVHQGLTNGVAYHYVLTAANSVGESAASAEVSATPTLGAASLYAPSWAGAPPTRTLEIVHDGGLSDVQNGAALKAAIAALVAGDRLEIGGGTWSVNSFFDLSLVGTAAAPIRIVAKAGESVVITRPDASQNVVNVGSSGSARYLLLQGLEIVGGSAGMRLFNCQNVWVDLCHVHGTNGAGITANTLDTRWIWLTRNEVHHTGGTGEGMYLGGNNSTVVMRDSVIALNHVHDTAGSSADGIELKQGSFNNLIAENLVHDTLLPAILVYGTDGNPRNVIERNVCYRTGDSVVQVQGEAIVRDNLIVSGDTGFHSHDHQGLTRDLEVVHNTIVNVGRAADLASWNNRPGMVFANNVVFSQASTSIHFGNGSTGVTVTGNVVFGNPQGVAAGFVFGTGLADFAGLTWDANQLDATPAADGPLIGTADLGWLTSVDLAGNSLSAPYEAGCLDAP